MIIGIGVDIVDMRRIEHLLKMYGDHFTHKVFTQEERAYAMTKVHPARAYANRFAAKEAALKALGTGKKEGIGWKDIEVSRASSGAPSLCFYGKAYEKLVSYLPFGHISCAHVSFSDEPPYSTAFVVISALKDETSHIT